MKKGSMDRGFPENRSGSSILEVHETNFSAGWSFYRMIINLISYTHRKNIFFTLLSLVFFLICSSPLYSDEPDAINEDDLFSDSGTFVDMKEVVDDSVISETEKTSVSLSGSIYNSNYYATVRDNYILYNPGRDNDGEYTGSLTSNLLVDMRFKDGIKGFINSDFIYYFRGIYEPGKSDKTYADPALREIFFDFNLNKKVYFRIGRQYLKWGRNYFWNPTDLINADKKDFLDPDKNLQGTGGVKFHIPFGTKYNIYGFVNLDDLDHFRDISWTAKFEFLAGSTEMAFSGWYKEGFKPVFGYDFSTRFLRIDWRGEMSISRSDNHVSLLQATDDIGNSYYTTAREHGKWFPKASLGFSKSYDLLDINDRVSVTGELFYNRSGYRYNVFNTPESALSLLYFGLYEPDHVSRYYGAFFTGVNRFILSDMTFNLNIISSLTDGSGIIYSSLSYNLKYDFFINLTMSSTFGSGHDEYTFTGNDKTIGMEFRYNF